MLAIARVMMAGARIVLMDEPTQGLAPPSCVTSAR